MTKIMAKLSGEGKNVDNNGEWGASGASVAMVKDFSPPPPWRGREKKKNRRRPRKGQGQMQVNSLPPRMQSVKIPIFI
jgi:hypothetical protein